MLERLPEWIVPIPLVEAKREIAGSIALASMERLAPLLYGQQETAHVHLHFGTDDAGIRFISGTIQGNIVVTCQRCLEALTIPLNVKVRLGVVHDAAAGERLPKWYEPLIVTGDPVRLTDLIEDELILCLPSVPTHGESELCKPPRPLVQQQPEPAKKNPFAVLETLKHQS